MTKYNTTAFEPSAPLALVTLRNKKLGLSWADAPMLIDSGADITLIPQNAVERLNLTIASDMAYELSGFDGQKSVAPMVRLELVFCERIFRGQFLLIDQEWEF